MTVDQRTTLSRVSIAALTAAFSAGVSWTLLNGSVDRKLESHRFERDSVARSYANAWRDSLLVGLRQDVRWLICRQAPEDSRCGGRPRPELANTDVGTQASSSSSPSPARP